MDFQARKEGNVTVVKISGRLDAVIAPEYEMKIRELIDAGDSRFVIDVAGLDYISSAGLRALLVTAKLLKAKGGQVRFAHVSGAVKEVFDISGFGSIFQIDESVAASCAALS